MTVQTFRLRPEQEAIAAYAGGLLRVSAVPGSGKTQTLAALVARLLKDGRVPPEGEILIVTFTNSAVDNIRARVRGLLTEQGALGDVGYRVVTLHGLAYLIIRERPDLAGTDPDFAMDDEGGGQQTLPEAVRWYRARNDAYWRSFIANDTAARSRDKAEKGWANDTEKLARDVIRQAKNLRWSSARLKAVLEAQREPLSPFLTMGAALYARYEELLRDAGRLDFDDLIVRAVLALDNDEAFRQRLGRRFAFILEDEAQDSTPLQEEILSRLSRDHGNWARVGDPNQAIMTTFTASSVRFFREEFPRRPGVRDLPLSVSGRSAPAIIALANRLAAWSEGAHPEIEVRARALSAQTLIQPTDENDPQRNPPDQPGAIQAIAFPDEETQAKRVAEGALEYVRQNPDRTCATLAPTNRFGQLIVDAFEGLLKPGEPTRYEDHLNNSVGVRNVADVLASAVAVCASPQRGQGLSDLRKALRALADGAPRKPKNDHVDTLLHSALVERLLFPSPLGEPPLPGKVPVTEPELREISALSRRAAKWVRASALPIDQLLLTIAHDTLTEEADLAIAHSLAVTARREAAQNPVWDLPQLSAQLTDIARNKQRYLSRSLLESGFVPRPGIITVTTLHKAKGLEWDRVYLTCLDANEFPHDADAQFRGEAWYLGGRDPALEARVQLEEIATALREGREPALDARALARAGRIEYIAERLRLLYVGVTRARRELRLSYASERGQGRGRNVPALALADLWSNR